MKQVYKRKSFFQKNAFGYIQGETRQRKIGTKHEGRTKETATSENIYRKTVIQTTTETGISCGSRNWYNSQVCPAKTVNNSGKSDTSKSM